MIINDIATLKKMDTYNLYQDAVNFARQNGMFDETDENYEMYNGDQWKGLIVPKGIEKVQLNFIERIVNFKLGVLGQNLFSIIIDSDNVENQEFQLKAKEVIPLINNTIAKYWEINGMDYKVREMMLDSTVNSEGILYTTWDKIRKIVVTELLNKTDVFYGDETNKNIEEQPYILVKRRMPVIEARTFAKSKGMKEKDLEYIVGDLDTEEEAGEDAKIEKDEMTTIVTKFYKKNGKVSYQIVSKYMEIASEDTEYTNYPITHMIFRNKKGSSRGEGEVKYLIPTQREVNKIVMRRSITVTNTAYQQKAVNISNLENPNDINKVGATLKFKGTNVLDVTKLVQTTTPAQMSPDVQKLQNDLIDITNDLKSASDAATGQIDPEQASGRAILAVMNASRQPLTEQTYNVKESLEQLARIWVEMIIIHNPHGLDVEKEEVDPKTGEKYLTKVHIDGITLRKLQATGKIDITPHSPTDKYAQETTLENFLTAKIISFSEFVDALGDDSNYPKKKLKEIVKKQEEAKLRIAEMEQRNELMVQKVQQYLNADPDTQAMQNMSAQGQTY